MRELKFRAWSNQLKSYVKWVFIKPDGNLVSKCVGYGVQEEDSNDYIIEQDTGLKDKNGKEIYEGDIVKISDAPAVSGKALVVKFDEFYIGEYNCNKMTGWMVQVINGEWAASLADEISRCEVIGNIHENGDLLK